MLMLSPSDWSQHNVHVFWPIMDVVPSPIAMAKRRSLGVHWAAAEPDPVSVLRGLGMQLRRQGEAQRKGFVTRPLFGTLCSPNTDL